MVVLPPILRHISLVSGLGGKPPEGYTSSKGMLEAASARRIAWPRPVAWK